MEMDCPFCKSKLIKIQINEVTIKILCINCGKYTITHTKNDKNETK